MQLTYEQQYAVDLALTGKNLKIEAYAGAGKCLGKGTKITMYDGTLKNVEDIIVGDKLLGVNGTSREVLSTTTGTEEMFRVTQTKGVTFECNRSHILSVMMSIRTGVKYNFKDTKLIKGDIVNLSVDDYLKQTGTFKKDSKCYVPAAMEFSKKELELEPYFVGLWLGDGSTNCSTITKPDDEIKDYLENYAKRLSVPFRVRNNVARCRDYCIGSDGNKTTENKVNSMLRTINVIDNKHIPHDYKFGSIEQRMRLVAGLLDSDGYLGNGCYEWSTSLKVMADDMAFVCRTLGFKVIVSEKRILKYPDNIYYRLSISGKNLDDIPMIIPRKKANARTQIKNTSVTGFNVESIGIGTYYGFTIGDDNLFLLEDFTVTHNTSTLSAIAKAMPNKRILYIAFNKSIAEDAKGKFPSNVTCKTTHSLAYAAVGHAYSNRLGFFKADRKFGWSLQESIILSRTLELFCQSSDSIITEKHLPPIPEDFRIELNLPKAANIWFGLLKESGSVTHDYYMKQWQLTNPVLPYDVILMDEAQDSNGLLLDVLSKQQSQVIYVGDRYQKLYAFRGAVDAMTDIHTDNVAYISQSFRFDNTIAEVANAILPNEIITPLLGFDKVQSELVTKNTYPYAVICRTNAGVLDSVIRISELGKRVHVTGGVKDQQDQIQAIYDIANGNVPSYFEFKRFKTIDQLKRFANSDAGTMFAPIVNYCIKRGISAIPMLLRALRNVLPTEDNADVICTTVHKSKGREFDHVTIYNDMIAKDNDKWTEDERCVLYVAITRAKKQLNISRCEAIDSYNRNIR